MAVRRYRADACALARASWRGEPFSRAILSFEFFLDRSRDPGRRLYFPRDPDNALASMKAAIDGLVDGGVLVDDSHEVVRFGDVLIRSRAKEHEGRCCVVVLVEAVG